MTDISISGTLGEQYGLFDFIRDADQAGPDATVKINSPGGDFATGIGIADEIAERGLQVHASKAASAAVPILAAGKHRTMPADAYLYLHRSWTLLAGDAGQLIKVAEAMARGDNEYAENVANSIGSTPDDVMAMMCRETTLSAAEALRWVSLTRSPRPKAGPSHRPIIRAGRRSTDLRTHMRRVCDRSGGGTETVKAQTDQRIQAETRHAGKHKRSFPPHIYRLKFSDFQFLTMIDALHSRVMSTTAPITNWPARWIDDQADINFHPPKPR